MSSAGAVVLAAAYALPLFYLVWSIFYGNLAGRPLACEGARVADESPPPKHNFLRTPVVTEEPYDYHEPHTAPQPEARPVDAARLAAVAPSPIGGDHG